MSIDNRNHKRHTHATPDGTSKTIQSAGGNTGRVSDIVARHAPGTPIGDPRATRMPKFLDMPSHTLHDILNKAANVNIAFQGLPSRLKGMFHNNPVTMLQWVEQPENRPRALELGLVVPTPEEAMELAKKAAKARRNEQVDLIREAMRPDPEAQPNYNRQGGKPPVSGGDNQ